MSEHVPPDRKYTEGLKDIVSWRLTEKLMDKLDRAAKAKGWNTTDLVVTVLDQYLQQEDKK